MSRLVTCFIRNAPPAIAMALCLFFASLSHAQMLTNSVIANNIGDNVSRPTPGSGHDYIHYLNETVNPANGTLNIKIDLPTSKARGFTLPFSLVYNSGEVHQFGSSMPGHGIVDPLQARSIGWHGWSDTLPYVSVMQGQFVPGAVTGINNYYKVYCTINQSYNFYDPEGGSHMLGLAELATTPAVSGMPVGQTICSLGHVGENTSYPSYHSVQSGGDDQVIGILSAYCDPSNAQLGGV